MKKQKIIEKNIVGSSSIWSFPARNILISLALIGITIAVFFPVLRYGFICFDDYEYVVHHPAVHSWPGLERIKWAFTSGEQAVWQPLVWISYMVDYQLYQLNPMGYHLTNLIFHLVNTLLLFGVLSRMTGFVWRSALVALLFAIHPLHVESVAWVAERKDVLSTFFWFLTLWAYLYYVKNPCAKRFVPVILALILGLMAKPMLVTVPFLLLLVDYWPLKRMKSLCKLVEEKIPLFLIAGVSMFITYRVQLSGQALRGLDEIPFWARLGNAFVSYISYLEKTFWPAGLAVIYPHPGISLSAGKAGTAFLLLVGIFCLMLFARRRYPYLTVGWFWYIITLLPVIGLIQTGAHGMADRFTYVPLIGIFIMVVWAVAEMVPLKRTLGRSLIFILPAGAILLILCIWARVQVNYWRSSVDLFEHAIAVTAENGVAHDILGVSLTREKRIDEAVFHFSEALKIYPNRAAAHYNLGFALILQKKLDEAFFHLSKAVKLDPTFGKAYGNLAVIFLRKGDYAQAWHQVHLCRKYGADVPPKLIEALSQKMPEPFEFP